MGTAVRTTCITLARTKGGSLTTGRARDNETMKQCAQRGSTHRMPSKVDWQRRDAKQRKQVARARLKRRRGWRNAIGPREGEGAVELARCRGDISLSVDSYIGSCLHECAIDGLTRTSFWAERIRPGMGGSSRPCHGNAAKQTPWPKSFPSKNPPDSPVTHQSVPTLRLAGAGEAANGDRHPTLGTGHTPAPRAAVCVPAGSPNACHSGSHAASPEPLRRESRAWRRLLHARRASSPHPTAAVRRAARVWRAPDRSGKRGRRGREGGGACIGATRRTRAAARRCRRCQGSAVAASGGATRKEVPPWHNPASSHEPTMRGSGVHGTLLRRCPAGRRRSRRAPPPKRRGVRTCAHSFAQPKERGGGPNTSLCNRGPTGKAVAATMRRHAAPWQVLLPSRDEDRRQYGWNVIFGDTSGRRPPVAAMHVGAPPSPPSTALPLHRT